MLATILDYDPYLGRMLTGKIYSGIALANMPIKALDINGNLVEQGRLTKLFVFRGVEKVPVDRAEAGDIVAIAGLVKGSVADTICALEAVEPIASTPIDPPTMSITITVNNSPFAGTEGSKVTSRVIGDRLFKEAEINVSW